MHLAEIKFKSLIDRVDANFYVSRLGAIQQLHPFSVFVFFAFVPYT
jgi:hypothetical protein